MYFGVTTIICYFRNLRTPCHLLASLKILLQGTDRGGIRFVVIETDVTTSSEGVVLEALMRIMTVVGIVD